MKEMIQAHIPVTDNSFFTVIEMIGQPDSTCIQIPDGRWSCSLQTISIVNFKLENLSQIPAQDNKNVK